jgi:magnesium chelatase family protein
MDLHISLPLLETHKLVGKEGKGEKSSVIQARVQSARDMQIKRYKDTKFKSNAELSSKAIKEFCPLSNECLTLLRSAVATMNLSARQYRS